MGWKVDVMKSKPLSRHLGVFAATVLIFLLGILIGSYVTGLKLKALTGMQDDLKTQTLSVELQYEILKEDPCSAINYSKLTDELYNLGERLVFMENSLGWDDPNVLELKEYFSLLELRHWLLIKKNNKVCGDKVVPILYFYSNKGDCPKCEQQGFILTNVRRNFPEVRVYHFDMNIVNPAIDTVKGLYNVKSAPTVVVLDETFNGFVTKSVIEEKLEDLREDEIK
ncbi:thioredoxin family protein [Candidatus Woesearchaeota archaeon]|nr:thioredoxin family protein [Candidatus Woesearchaeota archaeon]